MSREQSQPVTPEWNLFLAATCGSPKALSEPLRTAIAASGGRVLAMGDVSERCAEIDFEFARMQVLEIYGLLVGAGIRLSEEAHNQLTALCRCTRYVHPSTQGAPVRLSLTLYPTDGGEDFLANVPQELEAVA